MHEKIREELKKKSISTKAQQAVSLDRESKKEEFQAKKSIRKKEEKQTAYLKKREKIKSKKKH
ncbi:MAG: YjdF family protein [Fusobacteriales bacterium]|nr:YjdF family protein [Fusobacteriales bacterium]